MAMSVIECEWKILELDVQAQTNKYGKLKFKNFFQNFLQAHNNFWSLFQLNLSQIKEFEFFHTVTWFLVCWWKCTIYFMIFFLANNAFIGLISLFSDRLYFDELSNHQSNTCTRVEVPLSWQKHFVWEYFDNFQNS